MNSRVCLDANLALKLVMPETDSPRARALWQSWVDANIQRIAPPLFLIEGLSVIRNRTHRKLLTSERAEEVCQAYLALPVHIIAPDNLSRRAWELAVLFNRPNAYDSHYLALAEKIGCELWTADERLYNAVQQALASVKLLRQYQAA